MAYDLTTGETAEEPMYLPVTEPVVMGMTTWKQVLGKLEFREDGLVLGFRPRQGEILAGGNRPPQTTVHYDEERGELVLRFYEVENGLPADVTSDGTVCVQALPAGEPPDMAPLLVKTYGSERGTWPTGRRCGCACNFRPTPTTTSSPAGLSQAATATFSCSPSGLARAPVNTIV